MSSYDIVRDACVRANPGINGRHVFEIGFARCKFCHEPRKIVERQSKVLHADEGTGGSVVEVYETVFNQTDFPCSKNHYRPVRLADVLLAMKYSNYPYRLAMNIDGRNDTVLLGTGMHTLNEFVPWNLRHDSLEWHRDNAPEVIGLLADLLTNNKDNE